LFHETLALVLFQFLRLCLLTAIIGFDEIGPLLADAFFHKGSVSVPLGEALCVRLGLAGGADILASWFAVLGELRRASFGGSFGENLLRERRRYGEAERSDKQ